MTLKTAVAELRPSIRPRVATRKRWVHYPNLALTEDGVRWFDQANRENEERGAYGLKANEPQLLLGPA